MRATTPRVSDLVHYPESDGKPMGETDVHIEAMIDAFQTLADWFKDEPRVYVASDNLIYYEEGNPKRFVSPDCYVVKGVSKGKRRVFKLWEEAVPCFVLEVTSRRTRHVDMGSKMSKYRDDLGVHEYVLFDPEGAWIPERLRGYRLKDGIYLPIEQGPAGRLVSRELGLELDVDPAGKLRFWLPDDGKLPTPRERAERERAEKERERAEKERERAARLSAEARAAAAEEEIERLKAELARARGSGKRKRRG